MASSPKDSWQRALRLLTAGDRSEHELRERLAAHDHTADEIAETIRRLHAAGYLNDARVAEVSANAAARRGFGSIRARIKLQGRGIDAAATAAAIEMAFSDETTLARTALRKRFRTVPATLAERAKAARFLAQRGFPQSIVFAVLDHPDAEM